MMDFSAKKKHTIKDRTKQIRLIENRSRLKEGYLPGINVDYDVVYLGEGIVIDDNGSTNIMAINTREEDITIEVDPKEILPFEYASLDYEPFSDSDSEPAPERITDPRECAAVLKKTVKLNHLSVIERETQEDILEDYPDAFILPGDPLPYTDKIEH